MKVNRICALVAVILIIIEVALVIVTWLINAAKPEVPVRSLLSQEGVRWLLGSIIDNLTNSILVGIILLNMAFGTLKGSGLVVGIRDIMLRKEPDYRRMFALRVVLMEGIVFLLLLFLLTAMPHAVLLSVTGRLFPSSFSASIVPVLSFIVIVLSLSYGAISGRIRNISEAYSVVAEGQKWLLWILPLYILLVEVIYSFIYIFS